ncbi:MAG: radical SAM family heme chaperone HemW [Longimicrobiales bacterium]
MATPVRSVYVHAPFCARRCQYCDFAVQVRKVGDTAGWLAALRHEVAGLPADGTFRLGDTLDTVYVGGGTPSLLGPEAMAGVADVLGPGRLEGPDLEWTAEANPESLTPALARAWRAAGVNRISIGIQSFHEPALRWMGRLHGPDGARAAVATARAAGIPNITVDLIFGLPERLGRDWRADLDQVLDLDVPHVSLYGLTVEAGTALGRAVAEGREVPVDEERYREEFLLAAEVLGGAGYEHYEVSNFARPGFRARHNGVYWTGAPYLGLGNGAHSYAPPVRRWNLRSWDDYRTRVAEAGTAEEEREVLDAEALRLERVWLALRTDRGWEERRPERAGVARLLHGWVSAGLADRRGRTVRLTPQGWLVLDRLAVDLDAALAG